MPKTYLGDAVYAEITDFGLCLTTEDGIRATNTIHLEPEVLAALMEYVKASTPASAATPKRGLYCSDCEEYLTIEDSGAVCCGCACSQLGCAVDPAWRTAEGDVLGQETFDAWRGGADTETAREERRKAYGMVTR